MVFIRYIGRSAMVVLIWALLATFASGASNLLENGGLEFAGDTAPQALLSGWSTEGDAKVLRSDDGGVTIITGPGGAPFIFQQIESKRRYRGSHMTFSALVKTGRAESTALEFSNRGGIDIRSDMHPGDNEWHRLELTVRLPDSTGAIEFRVRGYTPGAVHVKEASLVTGSRAPGKDAGGALLMPVSYRVGFVAALAALMGAVVLFFRSGGKGAHARVIEAALLVIVAANIMLLFKRSPGITVVANISWGLVAAGSVVYIVSTYRDAVVRELKKPGLLYLALIIAGTVYMLNSLHSGSIRNAAQAADLLFAFVVIETVVILARGALAYRRRRAAERIRTMRIGGPLRDKGTAATALQTTMSREVEPMTHRIKEMN